MPTRRPKPTRGGRRPGAGRPHGTTRPTKPTTRTARLALRVSAELLAQIESAAEVRDMSTANYVRAVLRESLYSANTSAISIPIVLQSSASK